MAIIKSLPSKGSVNSIIKYVLDQEKTEERIISSKDCNPNDAIEEINATKNLYEKTRGLQYHHIIQSFKPGETNPEKAHKIDIELTEKGFIKYYPGTSEAT